MSNHTENTTYSLVVNSTVKDTYSEAVLNFHALSQASLDPNQGTVVVCIISATKDQPDTPNVVYSQHYQWKYKMGAHIQDDIQTQLKEYGSFNPVVVVYTYNLRSPYASNGGAVEGFGDLMQWLGASWKFFRWLRFFLPCYLGDMEITRVYPAFSFAFVNTYDSANEKFSPTHLEDAQFGVYPTAGLSLTLTPFKLPPDKNGDSWTIFTPREFDAN